LFIIEALCNKRDYQKHKSNKDEALFVETIPLNSQITLQVSARYVFRSGDHIKPGKVFLINKYLDKFFLNEMFTFINSLILHDPAIVVLYALDDFLSIYNITDDDILKESLYKTFIRHQDQYSYIS